MNREGRLEYLTWDRPWLVGDVDIKPDFWAVARSLKGKRSAHAPKPASYVLKADPDSPFAVEYADEGHGIILNRQSGVGFSNVAAYLVGAMCFMNGRTVLVTTTVDTFRIAATDNVFGVRFAEGSNMCDVSEEDAAKHCKPFTTDACLFACRAPGGWSCAKFSGPLGRELLDRRANGTIRAARIGSCEVNQRKLADKET